MTTDEAQVDAALEAGSALVGVVLEPQGDPLRASGGRSVVLRARRSDTGQTVIVKVYGPAQSSEGWIRETAALTALERLSVVAPRVIAAEASPPVVVMTDLGTGGSLATALLSRNAEVAGGTLVGWAEALADVHAATWNQVEAFQAALAERSESTPVSPDALPGLFTTGVKRLREAAAAFGIEVSDEVGAELARIVADLNRTVTVLSPTDVCPDNNVRTADGVVLIDFEGATVAHPAWDLAYLRVPWPSCWCAWRLPEAVSDRAERAWVDRLDLRLAARGLELDRAGLTRVVDLATLSWCLITVGWFLPGAREDRRTGGAGLRAPRMRAIVQHRLAMLVASDEASLGAGRELAHHLNAALAREWQVEPLPMAPAFR